MANELLFTLLGLVLIAFGTDNNVKGLLLCLGITVLFSVARNSKKK